MFKLVSALFALALLCGIVWLFWMFTYPLARRLGVIKDEGKVDDAKKVVTEDPSA